MAATTHSEFGADTESMDVAKAFAAQIRGKTVLVTGVNLNGIGFSAAQAFASQSPAHIIIAGRSQNKLHECIEILEAGFPDVSYHALVCDLSSQRSVHAAAIEVLAWHDVSAIDILVNGAGVMGLTERTLNQDGIEMHFATNHMGHWLLTCLIMPKLIKASERNSKGATRIINVTSLSPMTSAMRWSDINFETRNADLPGVEQPNYRELKAWGYTDVENVAYVPLDGYARSKVANVLFGIGANKRLFHRYGILSLAVHPGIIETDLGRNFPNEVHENIAANRAAGNFVFKSQGAGSSTSLVAALDPKLGQSVGETRNGSENWGSYLVDCQISDKARDLAVSSVEAEKLWALSEKLAGQSFVW